MEIKTIVVGPLETNCYVLLKDHKALIVDPGDEWSKIEKNLNGLDVLGIVITHYHFDHIGALEEAKKVGGKIYDISNLKEGINKIGPFEFECLYTPGHKEDQIAIYFKEEKAIFVGDFIFYSSIGRWDLEGGSFRDMQRSIGKILFYPLDITIYPGHGSSTSLGGEKDNLAKYLKCF